MNVVLLRHSIVDCRRKLLPMDPQPATNLLALEAGETVRAMNRGLIGGGKNYVDYVTSFGVSSNNNFDGKNYRTDGGGDNDVIISEIEQATPRTDSIVKKTALTNITNSSGRTLHRNISSGSVLDEVTITSSSTKSTNAFSVLSTRKNDQSYTLLPRLNSNSSICKTKLILDPIGSKKCLDLLHTKLGKLPLFYSLHPEKSVRKTIILKSCVGHINGE